MPEYEIRFLSPGMKVIRSFADNFSTDEEAIADAERCASGQAVEVWSGAICIYRSPSATTAREDLS
jgi:hypothetical protein